MFLSKTQSNLRPRSRMPGLLSALLSCHKVAFVGHCSEINTQLSITKNTVRPLASQGLTKLYPGMWELRSLITLPSKTQIFFPLSRPCQFSLSSVIWIVLTKSTCFGGSVNSFSPSLQSSLKINISITNTEATCRTLISATSMFPLKMSDSFL